MNLLINATPAKEGGAKTIVENYLSTADFSKYKKVVLLAPKNIKLSNNIDKHIIIETTGLFSWLFTTVFVFMYVVRFKVDKLVSFNNVNMIIPYCETVTYFHNLHILHGSTIRFKLLRNTIKIFMKNERFVFQTEFVKDKFNEVFSSNGKQYVNWCGCEVPTNLKKNKKTSLDKFRVIIPIVDRYSKVKNFDFILKQKHLFESLGIDVIVLSPPKNNFGCFNFVGKMEKSELFSLYGNCDLMIMPSLYETVGLPIFEFASTGKPVLVLSRPYLKGIDDTVGLTGNIYPFTEDEFETIIKHIIQCYNEVVLEPFDKSHPLFKADWSGLN